jgi:hypothetical protein
MSNEVDEVILAIYRSSYVELRFLGLRGSTVPRKEQNKAFEEAIRQPGNAYTSAGS